MKKNMPTLLEIKQIIHWTYLKCESTQKALLFVPKSLVQQRVTSIFNIFVRMNFPCVFKKYKYRTKLQAPLFN